ncbi:flagellar hook-associated protein 2 [Kineosphaera limosa]|uniref:Flagellar hook-associated protein 2 n=1 Tax=Kineosphaera limosa NBRC 100340 TaxID=1184609 RepID=K6XF73_9MICO|nr:flagellar filament capping protein FliD [Kineosphaera limosa]NYD99841.1 flagellar hook-associated protein 2 [Kineosphaera limosa]GAB97484.1 putative flagellar hook-associated protein 2 [Kineosphaera limosa NBRC 100340]
MAISVSGLSSGINTADLVSKLMQAERLSGKGLTTSKNTAQSLVTTLTTLNGQMKSLGDAAKALVPDVLTGGGSAFTSVTATSSNKDIATATTTDKAVAGSLTFTVKSIAAAGSGAFDRTFAAGESISADAFSFHVGSGEKVAAIDVKAGATIQEVAALINQSDSGVKATTVQVAPNTFKLQLTSATTGAQSGVNVTDGSTTPMASSVLGEFKTLTEAKDTVLTIGSGANAYDITSPTRDVKEIMPGVTITPVKADPTTPVTLDFTADVEGMATKVEAFVKAANEALGTISKNNKWDPEKKSGGALTGDSMTRALSTDIQNAFIGSSTALPSSIGISIERDGTLKFDKTKFVANFNSDPESVTKAAGDIATKVGQVSKQATSAADGTLTLRIQAGQSSVKDYTAQLTKFEERMTLREATLKQQFSAMESLLSKMQAQGNWLSGQLASLPTY